MPSSSDTPVDLMVVMTGLAKTAWQLLLPSAGEGGVAVVVICLLWTVTAAVAVEVTTATQLPLPSSSPPALLFPSSADFTVASSGIAALAVSSNSGVGS